MFDEVGRVGRVTRSMLATFRPFRRVSIWSGLQLTCPQQVVRVGVVEFRERHDKRTALPQQTAGHNSYKEVSNILVTCYDDVTRILRGSY